MNVRKLLAVGGFGMALLVVSASTAWACVSGPTTFVTPTTAAPGSEVQVSGVYFTKEQPVEVRFNALDGPVLGSFTPAKGARSFGLEMQGTIVVPPGTKPGSYVLRFTQRDAAGKLVQTPSRLMLTVSGPGGTTPALGAPVGLGETDRPPGLVRTDDDAIGVSAMLLIGLGAAGIGMFLTGMAALAAGQRRRAPEAAPVRR